MPEQQDHPSNVVIDPSIAVPSVFVEGHLPVGRVIDGRYRVEEQCAGGGMGIVYRCTQLGLGRSVAIKVMAPDVIHDAEFLERFLSEGRLMARLNNGQSHPNVVHVLDCGQLPSGQPYLVLEFLQGETLESVLDDLRRKTHAKKVSADRAFPGKDLKVEPELLPIDTVMKYAEQMLEGLAVAHEVGIIHRDMKPGNVWIGKTVKLLDFGIAKEIRPEDEGEAPMGTPDYINPEQAMGKPVGPPGDLYAVGVILYQMLTGEVPFPQGSDETIRSVLERHVSQLPEPVCDKRPGVPAPLGKFVGRLLLKNPLERYQTARIALAELKLVQRQTLSRLSEDKTSAGTPMPAAPTERFERVSPSETPILLTDVQKNSSLNTNELQSIRGSQSRTRLFIAAAIILALLAVGTIAFQMNESGGPKTVAPSPNSDVPPSAPQPETLPRVVDAEPFVPNLEASAPPPAQVEKKAGGEGPQDQAKTPPIESPVARIQPAAADLPRQVALTKPKSHVLVEATNCEPDERWKSNSRLSLSELRRMASTSPKKYELFEEKEAQISTEIARASTSSECVRVDDAIKKLLWELKE